jgi:hypothetical protein
MKQMLQISFAIDKRLSEWLLSNGSYRNLLG